MRLDMQKTMQEHAAVFRTGKVLNEGCEKMKTIYDHLVSADARIFETFSSRAYRFHLERFILTCISFVFTR